MNSTQPILNFLSYLILSAFTRVHPRLIRVVRVVRDGKMRYNIPPSNPKFEIQNPKFFPLTRLREWIYDECMKTEFSGLSRHVGIAETD